jgi:hypothetical protein
VSADLPDGSLTDLARLAGGRCNGVVLDRHAQIVVGDKSNGRAGLERRG